MDWRENLKKGEATRFKKGDPRTLEMAAKGGTAKGRNYGIRNVAKHLLSMSVSNGKLVDFMGKSSLDGLLDREGNPRNMTVEQLLGLQLVNQALNGDLRSLDRLVEYSGDLQEDKKPSEDGMLADLIDGLKDEDEE